MQYAYIVEDIERRPATTVTASRDRAVVRPRPVQAGARYRGNPNQATFTLARAFSGHAMIRLDQQHDDAPSVYHEADGPRRYGFHHWAVFSETFDRDVERYGAFGYEVAYSDLLPSGARIVYIDCTRDLPGMIELVEYTEAQELVYDTIYRASIDWDGADPMRPSDR